MIDKAVAAGETRRRGRKPNAKGWVESVVTSVCQVDDRQKSKREGEGKEASTGKVGAESVGSKCGLLRPGLH